MVLPYTVWIYWTTLKAGIPNMEKYYRNLEDLTTVENEFVEAGCLWLLENELLILVDDDRYGTSLLDGNFAVVTD